MSQILHIPLGMEWFRNANKYLENLYQCDTTKYGNIIVKKQQFDKEFNDEFDFIISNMGL